MNDDTANTDFTAPAAGPYAGPAPIAPPPVAPAPGPRPLLRDPTTRLGGVASGVAHYLGLDVSLVRLLFVVFTVMAGWGLVAYLAAWIIVPKAETWPPVGSTTSAASGPVPPPPVNPATAG